MQTFVVADYFRAHKLLKIIADIQEVHFDRLAEFLATPFNDLDENDNRDAELQVLSAIERLDFYRAMDNNSVVDAFQSDLLRLALCGRHRMPGRTLCADHPKFVEGFNSLLDYTGVAYPLRILPSVVPCLWCGSRLYPKNEYGPKALMDLVSWNMINNICYTCDSCFEVPTLEEWSIIQDRQLLQEQLDALQNDFITERLIARYSIPDDL